MVQGVYHILIQGEQHRHDSYSNIIWNIVVPLKVLLLAWRTLKKRIGTKENLVLRGVVLHALCCA